jgi:hypothetical protein
VIVTDIIPILTVLQLDYKPTRWLTAKVDGTSGNRACSAVSRRYRSGPVPKPARFPPQIVPTN